MAEQGAEGSERGLTAPYTAYSSVKTAARNMKEHGVPGRFDRSVLTNFSGSVASQIMQAFKFLGLTSDDGVPTPALVALVEAADSEGKWEAALQPILKKAYAPMFTLDLFTASPSQFVQHFRKNYPGADNVSRKSLTFFVNALQDAKIPVSSYNLKNKKPRAVSSKKRAPKADKTAGGTSGKNDGKNDVVTDGGLRDTLPKLPSEILLGLFDQKMGKPEQDALWTLIKFYKTNGQ
jgi:hypothetical protein